MHIKRLTAFCFLFLFVSGIFFLSAQSVSSEEFINEGLALFKHQRFSESIISFRNLILNPEAESVKADAYFWLSKAYMVLGKLDDAERSLEFYLANYPDHGYFTEAFYQKGRLLFMQGDYQSSIQVFQGFIIEYPDSPFVPNAYYWIGECLYSLGLLEDSAKIFSKVIDEYPRSYKIEAARYKISLIDFKKRERELLKLLKWSHEESLKTIEEFQRREKTYEQAIAAYQRRIINFNKQHDQSRVSDLQQENILLKEQIKELEGSSPAPISIDSEESVSEESASAAKLKSIKEEALEIKEILLSWLQSGQSIPESK
ncbi:MAG: tetratricopeptide repeat protein [Spirochaeta sp.]|nr:tetratricopeptide repeat protein [Spirochaeta sp.]